MGADGETRSDAVRITVESVFSGWGFSVEIPEFLVSQDRIGQILAGEGEYLRKNPDSTGSRAVFRMVFFYGDCFAYDYRN